MNANSDDANNESNESRTSMENLLIDLYNEFNNNFNLNITDLNYYHFFYIYNIYINMYNDESAMYNTILQIFNAYNYFLNDPNYLQTNVENVSPGAILERNRIKFTVIEKQNPHEYMGDCCSICLFDYNHVNDVEQEQQQEIIKTKCNHIFHLNCLSNWVNQSKTCPICRNEME
jgi:hypothetical protein